MKDLPVRKNIRLKGYDYSRAGRYFITICVKDRHELLGKIAIGDAASPIVELSEIGELVQAYLTKMNTVLEYVTLENYTIMPNHIHLLITLKNEIDGKSGTQRTASPTKAVIPRIVHGIKNVTIKQIGYAIWQRSYHDHIIHDDTEYQKIYRYIDENPARWENDCYYPL